MDGWEREASNAARLLFLSRPKLPEEEREKHTEQKHVKKSLRKHSVSRGKRCVHEIGNGWYGHAIVKPVKGPGIKKNII